MGVKGLWQLLGPVARPIKLETMEGKRLAIDSSIWLYQFQATMRDKDGRVLVNAHVLGFLRRINKLLFHGIKPVFVFDGGAPSLKRNTIAERKRKKTGAAANHAKVAEKLFAAQMRREAVKQAQALKERQSSDKGPRGTINDNYEAEEGDVIAEDAVYLDELDGPALPRMAPARGVGTEGNDDDDFPSDNIITPRKRTAHERDLEEQESARREKEQLAAERRKKFKNHDPYRLPDLPEGSLKPVRTGSGSGRDGSGSGTTNEIDPRMATEAELQSFIEDMKPEDFDLNSPDFRSLSTEMQYEIIGDLRIRSRQQSHKRLASMLRAAPTPLDFSKAQIASLSKRNVLTQQLLTVTDTIGTSGLQIPVRVAAERNREYVLVRNPEAEGGGWVLGVRDQGTKDKPIVLQESPLGKKRSGNSRTRYGEGPIDLDSDDDVEVVPRTQVAMDPELRALRQQQMLEALTRRLNPRKPNKPQTYEEIIQAKANSNGSRGPTPLFAPDEIEDDGPIASHMFAPKEDDVDEALAASLQAEEMGEFEEVHQLQGNGTRPRRHLAPRQQSVAQSEDESSDNDQFDEVLVSSRAQAALRRDEEDRALLRALKASKSDARLRFDAHDEGSIAGTISTVEEQEESDDESMEEVDISKSGAVSPADELAEDIAVPAIVGKDGAERLQEASSAAAKVMGDAAGDLPEKDQRIIAQAIALDQAGVDAVEESSPTLEEMSPTRTPMERERLITPPQEAVISTRREVVMTPPQSRNAAAPPQLEKETPKPPSVRRWPDVKDRAESIHVASSTSHMAPAPKQRDFAPQQIIKPVSNGNVTNKQLPAAVANASVANSLPKPLKLAQSTRLPTPPPPPSFSSSMLSTVARGSTPTAAPLASRPLVAIDEDVVMEEPSDAPNVEAESDSGEDEIEQDHLSQSLLKFTPEPSEAASEEEDQDDNDDSRSLEWSPSPERETRPRRAADMFPEPDQDLEEDEGGIDMNAEGDDYARFIAQIKGRDLEQVRSEIDNEIRTLNQQNKIALRDSEDITHQMIAQIQLLLRLFGIPYVTAPMEAEAQCAELARLDLVDGVITDDNDVFLFGGLQCFKNLFNDAKYVECFLAKDLENELSMTRDRLITIAYLLGSDYTVGLPGVGPVVAMELMANFPGPTGLADFKRWWLAVQQGKDDVSQETKWHKSFKKRFSDTIYVSSEWPNPAVADAYHHPLVDSSDEPFQWGFPDLSGLRTFLQSELSWSVSKIDDELTPIVQRLARRGQTGAANKQTILDPFFDSSLGKGVFAPRIRSKLPSKRLQAVIRAFREAEARVQGMEIPTGFGAMLADLDEQEEGSLVDVNDLDEATAAPKAKRKTPAKRKRTQDGEVEVTVPRKARAKRAKKVVKPAAEEIDTPMGEGDNNNDDNDSMPLAAPKSKRKAPKRKQPARKRSSTQASSTSGGGGLWQDDLDGDDAMADEPVQLDGEEAAELLRVMEEAEEANRLRERQRMERASPAAAAGVVERPRPKPRKRKAMEERGSEET